MFRRGLGDPVYPSTVTALMRSLLADYNTEHSTAPLPVIRLQDLRHTHATLLLKAGVPVWWLRGCVMPIRRSRCGSTRTSSGTRPLRSRGCLLGRWGPSKQGRQRDAC